MSLRLLLLLVLLLPFPPAAAVPPPAVVTQVIPSPAAPDSQCPNLTAAPGGTLYLTWSEPAPAARALRFATLAPGAPAWSAPRTIVQTPLLMENWADFASLVVGTDGALTAQWFQRSDPEARGYDGWYSRSSDGGRTWRAPARLGHEFVALAPLAGGRTLAVWLESARVRDPAAPPRAKRDPSTPRPARDPDAPYAPAMKLLARVLAPDGATLGEWTVDPDVCTCCQNTSAVLPDGRVFVAYRGHTADEIRDNRYAIFDGRNWSPSQLLKADGWMIPACPVNGPAADARGDALAVAWFTAAGGQPQVQARLSRDGGRSLGSTIPVDLGRPMGRIETVTLLDGSAVILWMEAKSDANAAGIYARRLFPDGRRSLALLVAESTQARASGFPRAALRGGGRILMTWTQTGEPGRVQTLEFAPGILAPAVAQPAAPPRRGPPANPEFCIAPLPTSTQVSHP
jgi:hypothetical protein